MSLVGLDLALISGLDEREMFLTVESRLLELSRDRRTRVHELFCMSFS